MVASYIDKTVCCQKKTIYWKQLGVAGTNISYAAFYSKLNIFTHFFH